MRDQAIAHGQHRKIEDRITETHAMAEAANRDPAKKIDGSDNEASNGIAAHEFRGTIHGTIKAGFRFQFLAAQTGLIFVNQPSRQIGINRHLLAGHGVQAEARGDFGDASATLGDNNEIHDQQDEEDNQANRDIAPHQKAAKGGNHVSRRFRPLMPMGQDDARGRHIQRQPEQRGQQQQSREGGEIKRSLQEQRRHQHQYR